MQYETLLAGAYLVEKTLDRSTYSVLCAGKRTVSNQAVRLRLWLTAHVTSPEEQQRIRAEVAAIQAIQNPHLLPILEVRATEQGVLLVSVSAQDGSLNTRLSQHFLKPLPLAEALTIVNQVGQALYALHERGITHGNLTPLAIFLTEPGRVCLGEFHLHSIQSSIQGYQPLLDENIPRCWYMAPEQFGGQLNARTDQYALGCLAYVLLTGRVPFAGSARATLLQKHQHEQPRSLSALNVDVPEQIGAAVHKALAKTPGERHSSVLAFLEALGVLAATVDTPVIALLELAPEALSPVNEEANAATNLLFGTQVGGNAPESKQPEAGTALNVPGVEQLEPVARQAFTEMETLKQPVLDGESEQADTVEGALLLPTAQPASAAGFSAISPLARGIARVPRSGASQATRARGIAVLAPMIALVLVIVLVIGGWLVLAGGRTPLSQAAGGVTPGSTHGTSATTATSTGSLQPTATATINAIGMHNPTPTARPAPKPSPTTKPTATSTPTASPGTVAPLPGCVTQDNNGDLFASFGYSNTGTSTVTIPIGSSNTLGPSFLNGFQPTSFDPGSHSQVFQVLLFRTISWTLNGIIVKVSSQSPMC